MLSIRPGAVLLPWALFVLVASPLAAQNTPRPPTATRFLQELNASVEALTTRVSLSVVQVLVTGYGPVDPRTRGGETGLVIGRQRSIGSGAIVDADEFLRRRAVQPGERAIAEEELPVPVLHQDDVGRLIDDGAEELLGVHR